MTTPLPNLPPRDPKGHKGTFGSVAVIGGCAHHPNDDGAGGAVMLGGPAFTALAALRSGCGLARLVMPEPVLQSALIVAPSATGIPLAVDDRGHIVPHKAAPVIDDLLETVQCIAIGPGLGVSPGAQAAALRCIAQDSIPVVVDADALNNLADVPQLQHDFRAAAILTPHIGEFKRWAKTFGLRAELSDAAAASELAQKLGCIVVLKSAETIVTDGHESWTHDEPNPALATGGTGDILTGIIAGLIAQHFKKKPGLSLHDCARLGVHIHALAAKSWTTHRRTTSGLLASELLAEIPAAIEPLRSRATDCRLL